MADDTSDAGADVGANRPIPYRPAANVSVSGSASRFFLKTASGAVFAFGEHEHFLWKSLDGRASFAEVERSFASQFGLKLTPRELSGFIAQGVRCGLIEHYGDPSDDFGVDFEFAAAQQPAKQTEPRSKHRPPGIGVWAIIVGDPTKLFAFLGALFWPLRYVKWLVFPGAFLAGMIILKNSSQFLSDVGVLLSVEWWPYAYLLEHFLNIVARITEGTIIQAHGGVVRYFGLRFLSVITRAFIDEYGAESLPKRARLLSKAGPMLLRLGIFDLLIFAWIGFRLSHPSEAKAAVFVAGICFILFCINACPILLCEGYELLSIALNQPQLARRAFRLVGIRLSGRAAPAAMSAAERMGLVFFALGTLLANCYIFLGIVIRMGTYLTSNVQGLGYLIMTCVFVGTGFYAYGVTKYIQKDAAARRKFARDALTPSH